MIKNNISQPILLYESAPVSELANRAIMAVVDGNVDPITAHINISRMEAAIKAFKENEQVRNITLNELAKYGKSYQFGDCRLEEVEAAVKYDYAHCGDNKLMDMYSTLDAIKSDIKERETMLRALPISGLADPESGEVIYPPSRSSKTTLKTTFKNK